MCYTMFMNNDEALMRLRAAKERLVVIDKKVGEAIELALEQVREAEIRVIEGEIAKIA